MFCQNRDNFLFMWSKSLAARVFKIPRSFVGRFFDKNALTNLETFEHKARTYDADIGHSELIQAGRNFITATGLQFIFNTPVQYHDAVFGYSMLYPYTDNLLDHPGISLSDKKSFSEKFFRMLLGADPGQLTPMEKKIHDMVNTVYRQYPINTHPQIQYALLSIFQGQLLSLQQTHKNIGIERLMFISMFKGSTSVLADAFLVDPNINHAEINFAVALGFLLQLVDDLEDISVDYDDGQHTIFTATVKSGRTADQLILKLLHFANNLSNEIDKIRIESSAAVKQFLFAGVRMLIFQSIASQPDMVSNQFYRNLETYSPFSFSKIMKQTSPQRDIEALLFNIKNGININLLKKHLGKQAPSFLWEQSHTLTAHLNWQA